MLVPILASVVFVMLFIVAYKYFRGYYPGSTLVEEPVNVVTPGNARLVFFYTLWCPHSKRAQPEWNALKELVKKQKLSFGSTAIEFREYDGDSDTTALARYQVDAFPTVVLETVDRVDAYEGRVTADGVRSWLIQKLGPESSKL